MFLFVGSKNFSAEKPAFSSNSVSFFVSGGPPSLQHRVAHLLHLKRNCFWVTERSLIVRFFGSSVISATVLFIVC